MSWLNNYNTDIKEKILPKLVSYPEVYQYLEAKTENFIESYNNPKCSNHLNSGSKISISSVLISVCLAVTSKIYIF